MDELVFLDTETTGNNLLTDRLFQVSYLHADEICSEYFKPSIPISIKAQSITRVTNKKVAEKQAFKDSEFKTNLQKLLKNNILVAHNAVFDISMLSHEGMDISKFICTLKVARFLDAEDKIPEYNLQFLRYYYELEIEGDSHNAEDDAIVLKAVFKKLYDELMEKLKDHELVIAKMVEISSQPFLFRTFSFGKYKTRKVEEIAEVDKGYLKWLLEQKMQNGLGEEDWIFTLKHYLAGK